MTGYTVHTGSTEQFSEGWDRIFGGTSGQQKKPAKKPATTTAAKKKPVKTSSGHKKS
jgi:hypothetical protein